MSIDSPYLAFCVAEASCSIVRKPGIDKQGAPGSAIRQAGLNVAKSRPPGYLE
jgi:hypothetical protein